MVAVDRRLWLTADGSLVEDGDPAAAFLFAGAGSTVSDAEAEAVGYRPAAKQAPAPENKAVDGPEDDKAEKPRRTRKGSS